MVNLSVKIAGKRLALPVVLASFMAGCDGGSTLLITEPAMGGATTLGSHSSMAVDSGNTLTATTGSSGAAASVLLAERTAAGPVKVMAVGDSITQGIVGASSYRREFTSLMQSAACSFTMVGSQQTSLKSGGDPNCEDTGVVGDGWGWDGVKSCLVGGSSDANLYTGAHEGYSSHRADHFLTGNVTSAGDNAGIRVALETYSPDVVLMHVGSVDLYHKQSVTSTLTDIDNILSTVYESHPDTLVLIANVIPWYSDNPYPEIGTEAEALGDGVEQLVADRNDPLLKLVDVRSGFTRAMMMSDMIHPNEIGEAHIADAFMSVYQPLANCASE